MKCIYPFNYEWGPASGDVCNEEAPYLLGGNSLCAEHSELPLENK